MANSRVCFGEKSEGVVARGGDEKARRVIVERVEDAIDGKLLRE